VLQQRQGQGGLESAPGYLGQFLSGGERQRIALARLLLRDPKVILCDEHVANIDAPTAQLIQHSLHTHFAGRTRVVVTHDLSQAREADWVLVIQEGQVLQQGTHTSLNLATGLYRDLCNATAAGEWR
jgi:ABC-type multidrug transport system fused ATPase/permease subunit